MILYSRRETGFQTERLVLVDPLNQKMNSGELPISIVGFGVSLPTTTRAVSRIFEIEAPRLQHQLNALSHAFRERLMSHLGVTEIVHEESSTSRQRGREAAERALQRAGIDARRVDLIIDYTTYAADVPGLWSLGHDIQSYLDATNALVLAARGSGCCGLHVALRTSQEFLHSGSGTQVVLLVASDRAPDTGRVCLPIAIMADAASALVVTREDFTASPLASVRAVEIQCSGRYVDVLSSSSNPPAIEIDAARFEQQLVPVHFVALNRVLSRAMRTSQMSTNDVAALVYPNTTILDRSSACRALGFNVDALVGPGPSKLGHAFANDLVINAQTVLESHSVNRPQFSAWLAAGSGFTWGAAIIEGR